VYHATTPEAEYRPPGTAVARIYNTTSATSRGHDYGTLPEGTRERSRSLTQGVPQTLGSKIHHQTPIIQWPARCFNKSKRAGAVPKSVPFDDKWGGYRVKKKASTAALLRALDRCDRSPGKLPPSQRPFMSAAIPGTPAVWPPGNGYQPPLVVGLRPVTGTDVSREAGESKRSGQKLSCSPYGQCRRIVSRIGEAG
jgi:hypothetical protein